jgi:glycosyltransferase involved in cell wall biosynthesis
MTNDDTVLSIITPTLPSRGEHLATAWSSLRDQEFAGSTRWEWLVQLDGPGELDTSWAGADDRISFERNERRYGPAISRNLALARSSGKFIKVLDADDQLTPGQLQRELSVLAHNSEVTWVTSRVEDLLPDGSRLGFPNDPPEGIIPIGAVASHWRSHNFRAQVHPATLCIRRECIVELGGWMALPASEDTGLLLALNSRWPGYFLADAGLVYRKWDGQMTADPEFIANDATAKRMRLIDERIRLMENVDGG